MTKIYTDENNHLCVESLLIRREEYNTQFVNGWLGYNQGNRWLFQIRGITFSIRKQKELPSLSEIFVEYYKAKLDTRARKILIKHDADCIAKETFRSHSVEFYNNRISNCLETFLK